MNPEVPRATLTGFSHMTSVLAFCADKPHNGGAYKL